MKDSVELTDEKTWDAIWFAHSLPLIIKEGKYPYYVERLDAFFHKHLPQRKDHDFLELGCAPGRWLHYFASEFGYKVSGLENSDIGAAITGKNLELLNIDATLLQGDALSYSFSKTFDVVFSLGLIEHFNPPSEIIKKHLECLKGGGYAIVGIPNLKNSLYYYLQKFMNKKVLDHHLLLNIDDLNGFVTNQKIIAQEYVGVFNLYLLNLGNRTVWYKIVSFAQTIIDKFIRLMKIRAESRFFSPYIFWVIEKDGADR